MSGTGPGRALICGSMAFDTIMVFGDRFHEPHPARQDPHAERLVPGAADAARVRRLRGQHRLQPELLGDVGYPMATVGRDFAPYREWMDAARRAARPRAGRRARAHRRRPSSPPTSTTTRSPRSIRARCSMSHLNRVRRCRAHRAGHRRPGRPRGHGAARGSSSPRPAFPSSSIPGRGCRCSAARTCARFIAQATLGGGQRLRVAAGAAEDRLDDAGCDSSA